MKKFFPLLGFLLLVFAISLASSFFTMPEIPGWYSQLKKAPWNPPPWVFGPVWTTLYIMIAISGWLVWQKLGGGLASKLTSKLMLPYWLQLLFNFLWSIFFFRTHQPLLALLDMILLMMALAVNIFVFKKMSNAAAYLLVPYFLWVSYAISLNVAIVILN